MNQLHFSPSAQQDLLKIKQYIEEELRNPTAQNLLYSVFFKVFTF